MDIHGNNSSSFVIVLLLPMVSTSPMSDTDRYRAKQNYLGTHGRETSIECSHLSYVHAGCLQATSFQNQLFFTKV